MKYAAQSVRLGDRALPNVVGEFCNAPQSRDEPQSRAERHR